MYGRGCTLLIFAIYNSPVVCEIVTSNKTHNFVTVALQK